MVKTPVTRALVDAAGSRMPGKPSGDRCPAAPARIVEGHAGDRVHVVNAWQVIRRRASPSALPGGDRRLALHRFRAGACADRSGPRRPVGCSVDKLAMVSEAAHPHTCATGRYNVQLPRSSQCSVSWRRDEGRRPSCSTIMASRSFSEEYPGGLAQRLAVTFLMTSWKVVGEIFRSATGGPHCARVSVPRDFKVAVAIEKVQARPAKRLTGLSGSSGAQHLAFE